VFLAGVLGVAVIGGVGWAVLHDPAGPSVRAGRRAATHAPSALRATPTTMADPTTSPSLPTVATTTTAVPATTAPDPPPSTAPAEPLAPVGVVQVTLVDASRPGPARGDSPGTPARQLTVTISYPTGSGTFPLVVFAHGFGVSASTYSALEHDLAAAGFVVAAPDFPLSSSAIPGPPTQSDIVEQAHDVSFVITSLLAGSGLPAVLSGHLAPTPVGVVGHSDGGTTVAEAAGNSCCADPRIGAVAVLSGDEGHDGGQWFAAGGPPVLVVQGTADDINPPYLSQALFDDASTPKLYVAITGGAHLSPYTDGPQRGAIATLLADFLRAELMGAGVLTQVLGDAEVPGVLTLAESAL